MLTLASLSIQRPEDVEQSVLDYDVSDEAPPTVGSAQEASYVVDVTVQNEGEQDGLITGIVVEFTDVFEPELCGEPTIGGGGGLGLGASYDIPYFESILVQVPYPVESSTRLEVPGRGLTRFDISIGYEGKPQINNVHAFAFDVYVTEASESERILLGHGQSVASVDDAEWFISNISKYAQASRDCMRANAEGIARILSRPGPESPSVRAFGPGHSGVYPVVG